MGEKFHPILTAEAWQLSNAPIFGMSVHKVALDIFDEIGIEKLILKSKKLTNYLEYVIKLLFNESKKFNAKIITPSQSERRGCQLSVLINHNANLLFNDISNLGIKIFEVPISYKGRDYTKGKKIKSTDGLKAIYCILKYKFF